MPRGEGLTPQRSPGNATLQSGWVQMFRLTILFMAGRIPAVPGKGLRLSEALQSGWVQMFRLAIFFMAGRIPAFPGGKAYASAKLSRVAGDDLFHGRSDTGVPRGKGLRLSEAQWPLY